MTDSLAMRGANAATGFVLSSLLVCGVVVVSDTGTYSLPVGQNVPPTKDVEPAAPTGPTVDADRSSTRQSITVPLTLRSPHKANGRRGAQVALPAGPTRPDRRHETDRRGDPRPGSGAYTTGASHDRPEDGERGARTSSRHSAMSARDGHDPGAARSDVRSDGSRATFRRGT